MRTTVFLALLLAFLSVNRPAFFFPTIAHADQTDPAIERLLREIENAETPLATLGLPSSENDPSVIRKAYRARISKFHSDRGANNPRYHNAAAKLNLAKGALLEGKHATWTRSWRNVSPQRISSQPKQEYQSHRDQPRNYSSSRTESQRSRNQKCAQAYAQNIRGHAFVLGTATAFLTGTQYLAQKMAEWGANQGDEALAKRMEAELPPAVVAYCAQLADSVDERLKCLSDKVSVEIEKLEFCTQKDASMKLQETCLEAMQAVSRQYSNPAQILQKCRQYPELEQRLLCIGWKI